MSLITDAAFRSPPVNGVTPWYVVNEAANRAHLAWLAYERAVRDGVGVLAARMALLAAMRAYEEAK